MNMASRLTGAGIAGVLALCGCAPTTPVFDSHFGESARVLQAQQTRNPDAPTVNRDRSVDGIDGRAAKQAIDLYQKSFAEPPRPANPFLIGIGGGVEPGGGER